jgi:hypothetical protein
MFQQPSAGGDKVPVAELVGALVLIQVREHRTGIITSFGEKDAVACDVHVLDGPKAGQVFDNALLFQGALIGALKPAAGGEPVLARIGLGTAKPGQSAPFILLPFTDADVAVAMPYWQRVQAQQFQAPAAPAAANPPAAAAPPAGPPAAATPSPAAASPATANPAPVMSVPAAIALPPGMTAEAFAQLPAEVQELIRQSTAA